MPILTASPVTVPGSTCAGFEAVFAGASKHMELALEQTAVATGGTEFIATMKRAPPRPPRSVQRRHRRASHVSRNATNECHKNGETHPKDSGCDSDVRVVVVPVVGDASTDAELSGVDDSMGVVPRLGETADHRSDCDEYVQSDYRRQPLVRFIRPHHLW
jgi:hypothetical protein